MNPVDPAGLTPAGPARLVGQPRVGSLLTVSASALASTVQWFSCGTSETVFGVGATVCNPVPQEVFTGPVAAPLPSAYRVRQEDLGRQIVASVRAGTAVSRTAPLAITRGACEVAIEPGPVRFRSRDAIGVPRRPGMGCARINLYISAKHVSGIGLGNNRGPSATADATQSKISIWINYEQGLLQFVANDSSILADGVGRRAGTAKVLVDPDVEAARRLAACIKRGLVSQKCFARVDGSLRSLNHLGVYTPSGNPEAAEVRLRYRATNSLQNLAPNLTPSDIDGIIGFSQVPGRLLSLTCLHADAFPSVEIYQDFPSLLPGGSFTTSALYLDDETGPADLDQNGAKRSVGSCVPLSRPSGMNASLRALSAVDYVAVSPLRRLTVGHDPFNTILRDYRTGPTL